MLVVSFINPRVTIFLGRKVVQGLLALVSWDIHPLNPSQPPPDCGLVCMSACRIFRRRKA